MAAVTEKWRATTACGMPSAWQWHANDVPQWHAAYQWHATSRKWNGDRHSARQFGTAIDTPLFLGGVPFLLPFSKRKKITDRNGVHKATGTTSSVSRWHA
jgi:hypothetical protein